MTLEQGTVVGSYRIEGVLGRGGMAVVYAARHVENGRRVALKVLAGELGSDPEFVERFRREGRLQASLDHPHVITVYDAGEADDGLYLALRLVPGSTLSELMHERALDSATALALLRQVAEALDAAHAAGLVHRDVKPQNVLVGDSDDAYLGDFGLTRLGGAGGVTATGRLMGTISYLAPEIIRGGEAEPASDVYAFAAMVFECLTGTVVYPRRTEAAILYAHTSEPPPRISKRRPELPEALDDVFAEALAKEPGERPRTAGELVDSVATALKDAELGPPPPPGAGALDETTVEPTVPGGLQRERAPKARSLAPWVLAAALAGAAVAAAVALLSDDDSKGTPVPATPAGAVALGSDLTHAGQVLDCRGRTVRPASPGCTIAQSALPGRTLVAPEDGVIRRWAVRSARGELSLAVLTRREGGEGQLARSRNEFVEDDGVHVFNTELAIERGDHVALVLVGGSGVGARSGVKGATTNRWIPRLQGTVKPNLRAGSGFDKELLLRVDYVPGARQRSPQAVTGAAAARLEPGKVVKRRRLRYANGRPVEIRLVQLGQRFVLDQFEGGRRTARIDVPDFRPKNGHSLDFEVYTEESRPAQIGIYMEWVNEESARVLNHFYDGFPRELRFIN